MELCVKNKCAIWQGFLYGHQEFMHGQGINKERITHFGGFYLLRGFFLGFLFEKDSTLCIYIQYWSHLCKGG